ncbi:hypothetical protein K466DRAFT_198572 [Polyporus arcularius HHB13444]|uniref:Uncharacterized protein n=1 Tax=Polyporus arcularius HHB13444 TaxID=1314778 RepID=A0A5C3P6W0_9APHY|nr:hypothetical protein K466DRAFT_198572 [Polyporus arcularius HHB13444]
MLSSFVILALGLVGAVQATPVASITPIIATPIVTGEDGSLDWRVPVVNQDLVSAGAQGNVTIGTGGVHADVANSQYPATIYFCEGGQCGIGAECKGFDLSIQPHQSCLTPGFEFYSIFIYQPSNEGLPYAIYTGPVGCSTYYQVPRVNTCYVTNGYTGWDFQLTGSP